MGVEATDDGAPRPSRSMPLIDEFFMYSMRVAAGMTEQQIADMFQTTVATVSRVTITWANYLFCILGTTPLWVSRDKIRSVMPEKFKEHCPNVRVILDCTEIAVAAASSLTLQSEMSSHDKERTTLKALVGVTPHGFVSFFSKLYTGSISDKEITELCGILHLLEPGDEVMADKDFVIDDLLSGVGAKLIAPPFKHAAQFTREDTEKTQAIARLRTVVERVISRIKSNHIWDSPVPLSLMGTVSQIWYNCCVMANFQGPLSCEE
uniref:DDE Tnp4 domain-containing protein n=1 Tax=Salarias fasciatus TaxID=181472 RepID=A0A672JE59_SALFA